MRVRAGQMQRGATSRATTITDLSNGRETDERNPGVSRLLDVEPSTSATRLGGGLEQLCTVSG